MTCDDVRGKLLDLRRRRLEPGSEPEIRAHLRSCASCARRDEAEGVLDDMLQALPRLAAPAALKRRLALLAGAPQPSPGRAGRRRIRVAAPALAAGLALFVGGVLLGRAGWRDRSALDALASEAVGDHLRVLVSGHPLDIESGGPHQVKPWFEGRLDFAPMVPMEGTGLELQGGAVGWFLDRRAAVLEYALRKHRLTLLAFRWNGLSWPRSGTRSLGPLEVHQTSERGFHVFLWRVGDLGYALVSDVEPAELGDVASRVAGATRGAPAAPPAQR